MQNETEVPGTIKVVIIDDFRIIVERLTHMLITIPGISFSGSADQAESALNLVHKVAPEIVIMDIHLRFASPKEGITLLNTLKRERPEMTLIVFTNYADTRYRHLCEINGVDFFFDKATDLELMAEKLKSLSKKILKGQY